MMLTGLPSAYEPEAFQDLAIRRTRDRLANAGTALVVMPTGAGKTITMGLTLEQEMWNTALPKVLVLQHTRKLLRQNRAKLSDCTRAIGATTSVVQGRHEDWSGDIVLASVASLRRAARLSRMPVVTHVVVDEAHRAGSAGYKRIIARARRLLPHVKVILYTATPNRADGEPIATIEDVAYQITYAELIDLGRIVPVRTMTIDLGLRADLEKVGMNDGEYDMDTVGALLDKQVHHQSVVDHWFDQEANQRNGTVGFCPTIAHAEALARTFRENNVNAVVVHDGMDDEEVDRVLDEYEAGRHQVILNCLMLIEGWDSPRTDTVVNLRAMAAELTFVQAVGRGMRSNPGKTDCLLLDFAGAALRHTSIEIRVMREREARMRAETHVHAANDNHVAQQPKEIIRHFAMREVDLMRRSKPRFVEVAGAMPQMIAVQKDAWAAVVHADGVWYAATRLADAPVHAAACITANEAMAMADRFLAAVHTDTRRDFEQLDATYEQRRMLARHLISDPEAAKTRYDAACHIAGAVNRVALKRALRECGAVPKAA